MFKKRLIPSLLLSALAGASMSSQAVTFSGVYVFGDSLSDAGFYRPFLGALGVPAAAVPILGRFTTNPGPVWSELVSQYYGAPGTPSNVAGGNIYAQGGARVAVPSPSTPPGGDQNRSVQTQITEYLSAHGGSADPNALYAVWASANDIFQNFAAIAGGTVNPSTFLPALATAEIQQIARLTTTGARYVLVFNLPDLGTTPQFAGLGPAAAGAATSLSNGFNTSLFTGLQSAGIRVIPVDVSTLVTEVRANAAAYGFTNITTPACTANPLGVLACGPTGLIPGATATSFLFADGVHPTTGGHRIVADFVEALIDGPQQLSLLAEAPLRTREGHIRTLDAGLQSAANGDGKLAVFAAADGGKFDLKAGSSNPAFDTKNRSVTVGVTMRASETFTLGVGVGKSTSDATFGGGKGGFETDETVVSLFGAMKSGGFYANASLSVADVKFDNIRRNITIGPVTRTASASAVGSNSSANVAVGYDFPLGKVTFGPFLSVTSQNVDVNSFSEEGAGSAGLNVGAQKRTSQVTSAGLRASLDIGRFTPFARVSFDREEKNSGREVTANPVTVTSGNTYGIPAFNGDKTWGTAIVGVRANLTDRLGLSLIYTGVYGRENVKQDAFAGSISYNF